MPLPPRVRVSIASPEIKTGTCIRYFPGSESPGSR
jgi:hypothetical protein